MGVVQGIALFIVFSIIIVVFAFSVEAVERRLDKLEEQFKKEVK